MTTELEKVSRHYDEMADVYDRRYDRNRGRCYYSHISRFVLERLPKGGKILDIGCGTGLFVQEYLVNGGSAVGLDISRGMIGRARDRCPASDFTIGTAERIPFLDNTFDVVSSLLAFSYVKNPGRVLSEAFRVVRPGGYISVCTLGKNFFTAGLPAVYRIGEVMKIRQVGVGAFGERYYRGEEMRSLFRQAGFTDITIQRCSFAHINLIDPLFHLARKIEPFVEQKIPYLAYNICASGRKPDSSE